MRTADHEKLCRITGIQQVGYGLFIGVDQVFQNGRPDSFSSDLKARSVGYMSTRIINSS